MTRKASADIRRATRKHYSSEEKIRVVLDGLCGEGKYTTAKTFYSKVEASQWVGMLDERWRNTWRAS